MRKLQKSFQQRREELRQALYRIDGAIRLLIEVGISKMLVALDFLTGFQ